MEVLCNGDIGKEARSHCALSQLGRKDRRITVHRVHATDVERKGAGPLND